MSTVQLSSMMVASGDATGNAYAKYSNNQAQSLVNDCDVFDSGRAPNCQNNAPQITNQSMIEICIILDDFYNVPFVHESMRKLFTIITALVAGGLTVATLLGSQSISAVSAAAALKVRTNLPPSFLHPCSLILYV